MRVKRALFILAGERTRVNSYFGYYLLWFFVSYAMREPRLLIGVAALLLLRRFIPAPGALFKMFSRSRRLRAQVSLNRANITARRDLAVIYLDGLRPRAAIPLLEEGLKLSPNDAELLYLLGLALHRARRHEEALPSLVRAVEIDARVRYGLPYLVAGDALAALGRWEQALDAYEHYVDGNSSDVSAYNRLARAHANTGDAKAAREALYEGLRTWGMLPASMKRRQFGAYMAAQWARATLLHEPWAILVLVLLVASSAVLVQASYAPFVRWFHESASWLPTADSLSQARYSNIPCVAQDVARLGDNEPVIVAEPLAVLMRITPAPPPPPAS